MTISTVMTLTAYLSLTGALAAQQVLVSLLAVSEMAPMIL